MSILAEAFEAENALQTLEKFASLNGPAFYRLPANSETLTLVKPATYPATIKTPDGPVTVFDPGFLTGRWQCDAFIFPKISPPEAKNLR